MATGRRWDDEPTSHRNVCAANWEMPQPGGSPWDGAAGLLRCKNGRCIAWLCTDGGGGMYVVTGCSIRSWLLKLTSATSMPVSCT